MRLSLDFSFHASPQQENGLRIKTRRWARSKVPRRQTRWLLSMPETWRQKKTLAHLAHVTKARIPTQETGAKNLAVIKRRFDLGDHLWEPSLDSQVSCYGILIPAIVLLQSMFNDQ